MDSAETNSLFKKIICPFIIWLPSKVGHSHNRFGSRRLPRLAFLIALFSADLGETIEALSPRLAPQVAIAGTKHRTSVVLHWDLLLASHDASPRRPGIPQPQRMLKQATAAFPDLAGLHTPEEYRWFFRERMFTRCELWGYFENEKLVGIIAFREGWIDRLYVLPSSQVGALARRCFKLRRVDPVA